MNGEATHLLSHLGDGGWLGLAAHLSLLVHTSHRPPLNGVLRFYLVGLAGEQLQVEFLLLFATLDVCLHYQRIVFDRLLLIGGR